MEYPFEKIYQLYYNKGMFSKNCDKKSAFQALLAYCQTFLYSILLFVVIIPTYPASALKAETLYEYGLNNIFYYDPEGENCDDTPSSNGKYKAAQYSFTEEQLKNLVRAAFAEQGPSGEGYKTELSVFANVYEAGGGEPGNSEGLISYLLNGSWFASSTGQAYRTGCSPWECYGEPSQEQVAAAKDILNNGNRVIPPEVDEHDSISDIASVSNNGSGFSPSDKAQYKSGVTVIHNRFGSTYTFFQWANGEQECTGNSSECGDPFGYTGNTPPQQSYSTVTTVGENKKYDGTTVLSDALLQQVEKNRQTYEKVAKKYNFPWQLLAALHYREHNLAVDNPANGEGMYQLTSLTNHGTNEHAFKPAGPVDQAEFERQTDLAAQVIRGKIGQDTDLMENEDNIKRVMFMYNWANPTYVQRAIDMGFTEEQAKNGEGSPYVMNMYDVERDPSSKDVSPYWTGLIANLRGEVVPDTRPGAFVIFQALGGTDGNTDSSCALTSGNGDIAKTALELSWNCVLGKGCHSEGFPPYEPKPEYVTAMQQVGTYDNPGGWGYGASCDRFVGTVMRYSGADPNFPIGYANDSGNYMISHPELYQEVNFNGSNYSILQPGDVFATFGPSASGGHIWIYVEIDGEPGRADASNGSSSGRTAEHYTSTPIVNDGRQFKVFRKK